MSKIANMMVLFLGVFLLAFCVIVSTNNANAYFEATVNCPTACGGNCITRAPGTCGGGTCTGCGTGCSCQLASGGGACDCLP